MYNVLVVDDEPVAIRGLRKGIRWEELDVSKVFEAYDAIDAQDILQTHPIDVMICDIEMPEMNGLALLNWVNERFPTIKTIFLTGHASFDYAQMAVKHGSFDYMLKPVDHGQLKDVIWRALEKVEQDREVLSLNEHYQHYRNLYQKQLPIVTERLWQDLLHYRIAPDKEGLQRQFEENGLPIGVGDPVLPILISLEQWKELFSPRDEEIMCYALRKTAEEVFLHDEKGLVVSIENDLSLVLLYYPLPLLESAGKEGVKRLAERYNAFCVDNFQCSVSCYIAAPVPALQLTAVYESLLSAEKANVINTCGVIAIDEEKPLQPAQLHLSPSFADWSILLEQDKEEELLSKLDVNMEKLRTEGADQESLNAFYYGFIHLLYQVFHKKGVLIRDVFGPKMLAELYQYPRSIIQLQNSVSLLMTEAARFLVQYHKGKSALLVKVQQYIEEHITDDFSREDIAGYVFLNPAYLSRWFKKETGRALSDYVLEAKMEKAKQLLAETNMKVSSVAESLGYTHLSHFAKIFKKSNGLAPHEYRKQYEKS